MLKKTLVFIEIILVLLTGSRVRAQEGKEVSPKYNLGEVIVSATKTENYQAEVGSSSTVVTAEDLEKSGMRTVREVLQGVAGVSVVQRGSLGGTTSVYMRGSEIGHTLVLIDGIEVRDPMQMYGGFFDFAHLTTDNIERVEIIRGPQSTLYGSDAIGGVINIITKKGKGRPEFEISAEGGSHNTFREAAGVSGGIEKINYSFSASRLDSDGISKARDGSEEDGYQNTTISSKIEYGIFDNSELSLVMRFTDAEMDLDDGSYDDDLNHTAWWRNFAGKLSFSQAVNDYWDHKLSFSYNDVRRKYRDEKDDIDTAEDMQSWYKGDSKKIEWQHNFPFAEWSTLTGGFEYEEERGSSYYRSGTFVSKFDRKAVDNKGYYFQNQLKLRENLYITPGVRVDDHDLFGTETTYKISGVYFLSPLQTRLKANFGTGFKAPSLYQLYSDYGNINLEPEESKGYDFGIGRDFLDNKFSLGLTYFHNDFKNLIVYSLSDSQYANVNKAKTEGLEMELSFKPIDSLEIGTNYTYTRTKDKNAGRKLARRPRNQIGFDINWAYSEKGNLNLNAAYIGHRWDDVANTVKIKPYVKTDINASYNLTDSVQIFGRIENLLDKIYQEAHGYAAQGRSFYGGCKLNF